MSYENMLTDRCSVYHLIKESSESGSFGVPASDMEMTYRYPDEADQIDIHCLFVPKGENIVQAEPNNTVIESYLIHFLKSQDVRLNDKIKWGDVYYTLHRPRLVHGHHIEVIASRDTNL